MKTWQQISKSYEGYMINKKLANPERRLSALSNIEQFLNEYHSNILKGKVNFLDIDKYKLRNEYEQWKEKPLSGAEKQVFNDFYNMSNHKSQ